MKLSGIKPKIAAFLLKEDGKISKKSIIKAGIVLGAVAFAASNVKGDYAYTAHSNGQVLDGSCPKSTPVNCEPLKECGDWHNNAAHDNNLILKNVFSKLVATHSHCVATHSNISHYYTANYSQSHNNGGWL